MIVDVGGQTFVDAGLVNWAYFLGMIAGIGISVGILWVLRYANTNGFKHYYQELDGDRKKELQTEMGDLSKGLESLALKTNTKYFKLWHNQFTDFLAHLKKRWMND